MQNTIDVFVSYVYRTSRKKEVRGDASVALIVQDGVEVPEKPSRSMIEAVRRYLSDAHQVKQNQITIQFLTRLEPEVMYVPEENDMGAVPESGGEAGSEASDGGGDVQQEQREGNHG